MLGWDEGAVYYSDQAQFPPGRGGETLESSASRHSILLKFKEFIRSFETASNVLPYRESLVHNHTSLVVNLEHLGSFDQELPSLLRSVPADYLPLVLTPLLSSDSQILLSSDEDSIIAQEIQAYSKYSKSVVVAPICS